MNPKVLAAAARAMEKARALRPRAHAWYETSTRYWHVSSATTDEVYILFRYSYNYRPDPPWWVAWGCTCPAGEAGLEVCWHKALVHQLTDMGFMEPSALIPA
jgi:hypothetical protein